MDTLRPPSADDLAAIRDAIDALDEQLVDLMARRVELAARSRIPKSRQGLPLVDPVREARVVRRAGESARSRGIDDEGVRAIFWRLIHLARGAQLPSAGAET